MKLKLRRGLVSGLRCKVRVSRTVETIVYFNLDGVPMAFRGEAPPSGSHEPVPPPFENGDFVIVAGRTGKVFMAMAIKVPAKNVVINSSGGVLWLCAAGVLFCYTRFFFPVFSDSRHGSIILGIASSLLCLIFGVLSISVGFQLLWSKRMVQLA